MRTNDIVVERKWWFSKKHVTVCYFASITATPSSGNTTR